jgi:hypothetical protein
MIWPIVLLLLTAASMACAQAAPTWTRDGVERFARLALACVHQEYPSKISHTLQSDEDAKPPRLLTPVFYGCYDWHSAVHGHWLLVRAARGLGGDPLAAEARAALRRSFTADRVAGEIAYLQGQDREPFERPYGLAWLLLLAAELAEWKEDPDARAWSRVLDPLEALAAARLLAYFAKLGQPARVGEHSQTAFALGLALDWARIRGRSAERLALAAQARAFFAADRGWSLRFEPSGQDFLSPGLAEADVLRRVLAPAEFAAWLAAFLPEIPSDGSDAYLPVAVPADRRDGKLAHLDGLNLSRAWMLEGILAGLPHEDPRRPSLERARDRHREAGLAAVTGEHYAGGHWLGSFALYLETGRGL